MPVAFRNVTASPGDPVATWPSEAIRAALERGGLEEWRPIAAEIRASPWGPVARRVEEILTTSRPYGVADLFDGVINDARARQEQSERDEVATELRDLVARSGMNQREFARAIGTSASRLSSYVNGAVVPAATLMVRARRVAGPQR